MRLFTKDADGKFDTPLSVWIGLASIGLAFWMDSARIGPGGTGLSWELGVPAFFLVVGVATLVPGILLTWFKRPE